MVSIKVTGIPKVTAYLTLKDKAILNAASKAIKEAGFFIEGEVKESISGHRAETKSVDTGRFLGSVKSEKKKKLQAKVSSDVSYAKHLEFGTSRISPRRHFNNTAKRNKKKVQEFIQKAVSKV